MASKLSVVPEALERDRETPKCRSIDSYAGSRKQEVLRKPMEEFETEAAMPGWEKKKKLLTVSRKTFYTS